MSKIILEEQASPSTPSVNTVVVYPKTDGLLYSMDDTGIELLMSGATIVTVTSIAGNTQIDVTGISNGTKLITACLSSVSMSSSAIFRFQLGSSTGIEAAGYSGSASFIGSTTSTSNLSGTAVEWQTGAEGGTGVYSGPINCYLSDSSNNTWTMNWVLSRSDSNFTYLGQAMKTVSSGIVDRIRLLETSGSFDSGTLTILTRS